MSWNFSFVGTRDAVLKKVDEACDRTAASYAGKPEADDVLAVKARVHALVDAMGFDDTYNAVSVTAGGSHSTTGDKLLAANFKLDVSRTSLSL